jgi:hypothetical protein
MVCATALGICIHFFPYSPRWLAGVFFHKALKDDLREDATVFGLHALICSREVSEPGSYKALSLSDFPSAYRWYVLRH